MYGPYGSSRSEYRPSRSVAAAAVVLPTTETIAPTTGRLLLSSTRPSMLPAGNVERPDRASFAGPCAYAIGAPSTNATIAAAGIHRIIIPRSTPARRPAPFPLRHSKRHASRDRLTVRLIGNLDLQAILA